MRFLAVGNTGDGRNGSSLRAAAAAPRTWLSDILEAWGDTRFAQSESHRALSLYRRVKRDRPDLNHRELYSEVVARCAGASPEEARSTVRHAEESFAAWPAGRDVRFRDVVTYIIVDERVTSKRRAATSAHIEAIVAGVIASNL